MAAVSVGTAVKIMHLTCSCQYLHGSLVLCSYLGSCVPVLILCPRRCCFALGLSINILLSCCLKGPIHDQSCCATLRVVQHDWSCMVLIVWSWMGKLVLRKTILRNMIDRVWAPLKRLFSDSGQPLWRVLEAAWEVRWCGIIIVSLLTLFWNKFWEELIT
jgi:hypothetical protein